MMWNKANLEHTRETVKRYDAKYPRRRANAHYLSRYGITYDQKTEMLTRQGSRCACCGETAKRWHLDHDHKTKRVRGVLCQHCNWLIGHAREKTQILRAAIAYLTTTKPVLN